MNAPEQNTTHSNDQVRRVTLSSREHTEMSIELQLLQIPKSIRLIKGLKIVLMLWACAALGALIPFFHFVLVPGFFLAGLFFAISAYTDDVSIRPTELVCLNCKHPFFLKTWNDQFPKWANCSSCGSEHKLELFKG